MNAVFPEPVAQGVELAGGGAEDARCVAGNGNVEGFAADINAGSLRVEDRQSLHRRGLSLRLRRARSVLVEDKPTQREHRTRGVAKQTKCRGPEPFSPTGSLRAPKGKAVINNLHDCRLPRRKCNFSRNILCC